MILWDESLPTDRQGFLENVWLRFQQQRATRKRMTLDQLAIAYGRLLADLYADAQAVETLLSETGYTREIEA